MTPKQVCKHILQSGWGDEAGIERLRGYAEELAKWQKRINLVAPSTLPQLWERHILDSAQVMPLLPDAARHVADFGSGGGLPVVVMACLDQSGRRFTAVESVGKKAQFLKHCARLLDLPLTVENKRIEDLPPLQADLVTARALADLGQLINWATPHLAPDGGMLFLKGERAEQETAALASDHQQNWVITSTPSLTNHQADILTLTRA
ncbi:MAG: 16S rRNA (guanine(527)-N(7))-methyltransferase RsmG [Alphaproteobacteria bacterium]